LESAVSALHQQQHTQQLLLLTSHLHRLLHGSCLPCPAPSRIAEQQHASLAQRCRCSHQLQDALLLLPPPPGQRLVAHPASSHPSLLHQQQLLQLPLLLPSQLQLQPQQPCQHSLLAAARPAAGLLLLLLLDSVLVVDDAGLTASAQWCCRG
jgi:hypothetical protein